MKKNLLIVFLVLLLVTAFLAWLFISRDSQDILAAEVVGINEPPAGFQRADGSLTLSFPQDHGPHPDFQTEWWYYTGNLDDGSGRHFGYQLTFFRRSLVPLRMGETRQSNWASGQVFLAHFAISDVAGKQHIEFERISRGIPELAGAQSDPFRVWLEDWEVVQTGVDRYELRARQEGIEIVLDMVDLKGPVLHGEQGYSQKGPSQGNASYYISQTRLRSTGTIRIENTSFQVSGLSWMDHEFSTSALSEGQVGWDWFSIQLDNETELMVFQIRREDGTVDSYSSGTIIQPDATTLHLTGEEFTILVEDTWTSPSSGAEYPANWKVTIPLYGIQLEITPYLADQEMQVNFTYWEGCVFIEGEFQGEKVSGAGYVEMTGYTESMEGEF